MKPAHLRLRDRLRRHRFSVRDGEEEVHQNRPQRQYLAQQNLRPGPALAAPRLQQLRPHPLRERQLTRPARLSRSTNSSSLTLVLTLLMRDGGFNAHRLTGIFG